MSNVETKEGVLLVLPPAAGGLECQYFAKPSTAKAKISPRRVALLFPNFA